MSAISEGVPPSKRKMAASKAKEPKGGSAKEGEEPPIDIWQDCLRKFDEDSAPQAEEAGEDGVSTAGSNEPYTLLVLGDTDAGKWTLANHLRKVSGKKTFPKKLPGVPLSYTYVAIEDEDGPAGARSSSSSSSRQVPSSSSSGPPFRFPPPLPALSESVLAPCCLSACLHVRSCAAEGYRMNTWVLDKPEAMPRFLTTALASSGGFNQGQQGEEQDKEELGEGEAEPEPEVQVVEETDGRDAATSALDDPALLAPMLERSVAIVCVDLSKPWNTWVKAVSDETKAVLAKIDAVDRKAATRVRATLKERVQKVSYTQPPAEGEEAPADSASAVQRLAGDSMEELGSTYEGVPLIVVPCKSDEINDWPAKLNFQDAHIDYVKAHLRKICLGCGAGLVYTSAKQDTNIDKLRTYLLSRVVPGKAPPALNDEDTALDQTATYVPAGTDTVKKIDSLLEVIFGAHHPGKAMALTGDTSMYPKLEQHIISEIKRLAREDGDLQQSYDSDGEVTTAAMLSGIKNWMAHCIDGAITKEKDVPEALTTEVNRVLGVGLATEDKGSYVPMPVEEAAQQDGSKKINVENFLKNLRGSAKEITAFEWVVMDPNTRAKAVDTRVEVVDDQDFLAAVAKMEPDKEVARTSVRSMPTSMSSPARTPGKKAGGGDDLKTDAADFFNAIAAKPAAGKGRKVRSPLRIGPVEMPGPSRLPPSP